MHINRNLARSLLFGRRNIVCVVLAGLVAASVLEEVCEPDGETG